MAKMKKKYELKGKKMMKFDALPKGWYLAEITESEWKTTKASDGEYLKLVFEILKGDFKGRKYFENLNLENANPDAVRIAEGTLADIHRACGFGEKLVKDSEKLHNIPVMIELGIRKGQNDDDQNTLLSIEDRKSGGKKDKKQDGGKEKPVWEDDDHEPKKKKKKEDGGKKKKDKKKKKE